MTHTVDPSLIALGVQQPWAELLVRGEKTIEVRSRDTSVTGTIYIYASKTFSKLGAARTAVEKYGLDPDNLPRQKLVGTVDVIDSRPAAKKDAPAACLTPDLLTDQFAWLVENAVRFEEPLDVEQKPYGVWFYPFGRDR